MLDIDNNNYISWFGSLGRVSVEQSHTRTMKCLTTNDDCRGQSESSDNHARQCSLGLLSNETTKRTVSIMSLRRNNIHNDSRRWSGSEGTVTPFLCILLFFLHFHASTTLSGGPWSVSTPKSLSFTWVPGYRASQAVSHDQSDTPTLDYIRWATRRFGLVLNFWL